LAENQTIQFAENAAVCRRAATKQKFFLCVLGARWFNYSMLSHVVIFWTDPARLEAADAVIAGGNKYLQSIPGVLAFHIGKMVPSHRPVVEQSYQVALNLGFADKHAEHLYQSHPQHLEFVEHCVKPFVKKVVVYDFE
jgi:hypothetical protein